jgi:sortase A
VKTLANVFAAVSLLALGYCAVVFVSAHLYQARESRRFISERQAESDMASLPEAVPKPKQPYPDTGSVVGMLAIPRLGMSTAVVEGAEERELKLGPGHIPGTSLPGGGGNVAVAGHRDTFFRPLRLIHKDDTINLITHEREYQYKVVSTQIVEPENIQVLYPTDHETLTLVTCYPFDFVGPAPRRFIVRADCADCQR